MTMNNDSFIERLLEQKSKLNFPEEVIKGFETIHKFDKILNEKSRLFNSIDDHLHKLDTQSTVLAAEQFQLQQQHRQLFLTQPDEELLERLFPTKGLGIDDSDNNNNNDDDDDDDDYSKDYCKSGRQSAISFDDSIESRSNRRRVNDMKPELIEMAPPRAAIVSASYKSGSRGRMRSKDDRLKLPDIGKSSEQSFQQDFIKRNKELLADGKFYYAMTESEKQRLESILANRRTVPSKEIMEQAATAATTASTVDEKQQQSVNNTMESSIQETEEDLMFINEFLPDASQARELDEINQQLKKISKRLFQHGLVAIDDWECRLQSATAGHQQQIRHPHHHTTNNTIADSQTTGVRSVVTVATTVDDVMTRNFQVVLREFEEETRRLRQIDARLEQLQSIADQALPPPTKDQLEKLLASGLEEEDLNLFENGVDLGGEDDNYDGTVTECWSDHEVNGQLRVGTVS